MLPFQCNNAEQFNGVGWRWKGLNLTIQLDPRFMDLAEIGEHYMAIGFCTAVVKELCLMDLAGLSDGVRKRRLDWR